MWPLPFIIETMDEIEIMDDGAFTVFKTRWGTYASRDKDGKDITSGLDKQAVIFWSREHLTGFPNSTVIVAKADLRQDSLK
jgi:hypothetical protein